MAELAGTDHRAVRRDAEIATIVSDAWALSRAEGLAGISLRDLADRVGLRQPSLHAYFDSKLALYDAMFADANRQLLAFTANLVIATSRVRTWSVRDVDAVRPSSVATLSSTR